MEIILLRHAETKGNLERRYIGLTDEPLCEEGIRHAKSLGSFPEIKSVAVSPLLRAKQTARLIFPNAELTPYEGLEEMHFGYFEGKNFEEMSEDPRYRAWVDSFGVDHCPGGESRDEFISRTCEKNFQKTISRQ
jgi:alpha-ribazole phosphatase